MTPFTGELIGTFLLILFGDGVVANVLLKRSKGEGSGWIVITTGWALAVFIGVAAVARVSGAHLNPAVSVGLATAGLFDWSLVPLYVTAQMIGAFLGAITVWLAYLPHWAETENGALKRAVFCTEPAIRSWPMNLICEIIGTFALLFGVLTFKGAFEQPLTGSIVPVDLGALGAVPVALLVWAIGLSLGGPTGYAINPARDLGPRIAHALLPIPHKAHNDWGYSWVPIVGPLIGAAIAAILYMSLGKF